MSDQIQLNPQKRKDVPLPISGKPVPFPVLGTREANQMIYEDGVGVEHTIYLPKGRAMQAAKYYKDKDWEALERFPKWSR